MVKFILCFKFVSDFNLFNHFRWENFFKIIIIR